MEKFDEKGLGIESPVYYRIEDMIEILTLGKNSERLVAEVPLDELEINKPKQIAMK